MTRTKRQMQQEQPEAAVQEILDACARGVETANDARLLREGLRWQSKPGSDQRQRKIDTELRHIDTAMRPIRRHLGRLNWHPTPDAAEKELRRVSKRLGYERAQLKKMVR